MLDVGVLPVQKKPYNDFDKMLLSFSSGYLLTVFLSEFTIIGLFTEVILKHRHCEGHGHEGHVKVMGAGSCLSRGSCYSIEVCNC